MQAQHGFTIWLTGMSGAGKSTLAEYLAPRLALIGRRVELLDGDELQELLSKGLDFSKKEDQDLNVRRFGWVAKLLSRNGAVTIVSAVSPYREVRDEQRRQIGRFVEVFADCAFDKLVERDTKGLYRKALAGEISNLTGVQEPYEPPNNPDVVINSGAESVRDSGEKILDRLYYLGYLNRTEHQRILASAPKAYVEPPPPPAPKALKLPKSKLPKPAPVAVEAKASKAPLKVAAKAAATKPAAPAKKAAPARKPAAPAKARDRVAPKASKPSKPAKPALKTVKPARPGKAKKPTKPASRPIARKLPLKAAAKLVRGAASKVKKVAGKRR